MSGDQNNNQQNQQKQKGGGQQGKEGISISQSWSAANPGSIPQQMKVAFINAAAYSFVPLIGGLVAKSFDFVGKKFFGVKSSTPSAPALPQGNPMQMLHSLAGQNPEEAKRIIESVSKRLGLPAPQQQPAPVEPVPAPAEPVTSVVVDVEPTPQPQQPKQQQPKPQQQKGKK